MHYFDFFFVFGFPEVSKINDFSYPHYSRGIKRYVRIFFLTHFLNLEDFTLELFFNFFANLSVSPLNLWA
jgi:hypothetical protein